LALDLGTQCGWCRGPISGPHPLSGALNLKGGRFDTAGMVYLRFENHLAEMLQGTDRVVFEEVRRHAGVDAAHRYGGLLAVLLAQCEKRGLPAEGISVGTWKKHATSKGNASKGEVIRAVQAKDFNPKTEDEADAIGIWLTGANR
jgi:Holliday junction resolvasome RuvABC endonuclease subunit